MKSKIILPGLLFVLFFAFTSIQAQGTEVEVMNTTTADNEIVSNNNFAKEKIKVIVVAGANKSELQLGGESSLTTNACAKPCTKPCGPKIQLGVMLSSDTDELIVEEVVKGRGADRAGIQVGDLIQSVNGVEVATLSELHVAISEFEAGQKVKLGIVRNGKNKKVKVELTEASEKKCTKEEMAACQKKCSKEEMASCKKKCTKEELAACKKKCSKSELAECQSKSSSFENRALPKNSLRLKDFQAFPNPTDGEMNIKFSASKGPLVVQIMDISGRTIFKDVNNYFEGHYSKQIDLADQTGKTVILSIIQSEKMYTEKLVVN